MKDKKYRTETGQQKTTRYGKDDVRYWKSKLKKRTYRHHGETIEIPEWQIRLTQSNREVWFNLGTKNKESAAAKAREIYLFVRANGLNAGIQKYKVKDLPRIKSPTIGEFFDAVRETGLISPRTLESYCQKFRTLAAGIFGIPAQTDKYNPHTGGLARWRGRIESRRLSAITPDKVQRWARDYVNDRGKSPVTRKKAEHTVNSYIRNARSLFSKRVLKAIQLVDLPDPLPFEEVELFSAGSMRYRSEVDPTELLKAANAELADDHPEQFKAFILCLLVGLRRREVDLLLWRSIYWDQKLIRIERNEFFSPKREYSLGDIPVEPAVLAVLRQYFEDRRGSFVLESSVLPKPNALYPHYRANRHFSGLIKWLRKKGVCTNSPIHTLRKEYGRLINENYGIFAASKLLRHANIGITAAYYADDTRRLVSGIGHLLGTAKEQEEVLEHPQPSLDEPFVVDCSQSFAET